MSCTSCGENPTTVGEVKACKRCQKAGIVIEGLEDSVALGEAIARQASLAQRFVNVPVAKEPPAAPRRQEPEPARQETKAKPKAPARKPAKKAPARKAPQTKSKKRK